MDGKWPMSLEDEWLSNSLKLSACQYLCVYHPCMIGIPTSSYTKFQTPNISEGCRGRVRPWLFLVLQQYLPPLVTLYQCHGKLMHPWNHPVWPWSSKSNLCNSSLPSSSSLKTWQCFAFPRLWNCWRPQMSFQICEFCGFCGSQCSVDVKKISVQQHQMPTDFLLHNAERKNMGFQWITCMWPKNVDKCYTNCVNSSTSPLASPSVEWLSWASAMAHGFGSWLINIHLSCKHSNRSLQCAVYF